MCSVVDTALHVYKLLWSLVLVIGTFSLFIIVLPEAVCCCVMLLFMDCMCIPSLILSFHWLHTQIYNAWPEATFQCETESKRLTNF